MHLKSIEINGFKSFANKIIFEFPYGITGIVGPNGSGKSNIGDAVRWVLGEQSARQLRGTRMEDVIFSGTENRRPLGFAYVAIVFDNTDRRIALDYDEVKVARRVYRSGESEYLINGATCRRKDIVEIFYDTGIGKEGYSIIGQGQVEKILSGKMEDSRELFDEAAGIAKYKKNRAVTEKSLEQEHQNLERVTDVLKELEQRVGPLESQSKKAKEYLKLKEQEKDLDLHLFLFDYERLQEEKKENQRQYEIVARDLEDTRAACEQVKEKNAKLSEKNEKLVSETEQVQGKKEEEQGWKNALEAERVEVRTQMESNQRLMEHYEALEAQAGKDREQKNRDIEAQKQEIAQLEQDLSDLQNRQQEMELELADARMKKEAQAAEISGKRDNLFSLITSDSDTKEKLSRYETMEEQLQIRNAEYNSRLIAFQSERKDYEKKADLLREELEQTRKEAGEGKAKAAAFDQKQRERLEEQKKLRKQLETDNQEFLRARSRYETLRNISERYDGYHQSIRHVMEQKKDHPGLLGVVADLLSMDKKYETAIEIALGGALQNIVTQDDQTAKDMILFLKKNRLGRATFLPLTNIRKKNIAISPQILEEEGVIGVASSLVTADSQYENLILSLLGRTIVVDTIDHAQWLARKNNFSLRIVTLDGELLNPGGAITGGAFRHSGNLLGRKREVEECQARMQEKEQACRSWSQKLHDLQEELKQMDRQREEHQKDLQQWNLKLHDLHQQIPEVESRGEELGRQIRSMQEEHNQLNQQLEEIRKQKTELLQKQQSNEKIHEENTDLLDQLNQQLAQLEDAIAQQEHARNELRLTLTKKEQRLDFCREALKRLYKERGDLKNSQESNRSQREEMLTQNEELQKQLAELDASMETFDEHMEAYNVSLVALREKQKALAQEQNVIFQELQEKNDRLLLLEKEAARLTSRLEKVQEQLEQQMNYMWENYELTYNYACELRQYSISARDVSEYRASQKEVSRQIRQLGSVNINAIEEYKEVGERYEFMRAQYDDICKAEEHLTTMIEELNTAMREQFTVQFQEIRTMFRQVFADLFEGGQADLELMDNENILECGIRIVAQPPGKKLQNIMLLSGGERALTAIALLFAIQQLKPSPFCLLDEIEAALDDANIVRFSKYLKRLSKDTQFIVITHRRGTMTAADALYGITMQEKGVSTLISVDLIDKELDA